MSIEELIVYGKKYIHSNEAKMLLSHILKYDNLELLNHLDECVSEIGVNEYKKSIRLMIEGNPIQYILGNVNFYGYNFYINKNVLIPRFETEELVENTIKFIKSKFNGNKKVLDLGTGSGIIGITLKKKLPFLDVTLSDISELALKVAKKNKVRLNVNVKIIKSDVLDDINDKYDIIISNPPYIRENEDIEEIVKNNEPSLALYGGKDGLYYYDKILKNAKKVLNEKFLIAFEIGCLQKKDIIKLANKYFNNIETECFKDLSEKDRMIFIYNV